MTSKRKVTVALGIEGQTPTERKGMKAEDGWQLAADYVRAICLVTPQATLPAEVQPEVWNLGKHLQQKTWNQGRAYVALTREE